ncbi:MAG: MFS transporter [Phycisphaerales bacterium]|nr:MFS transporter [Phycisphaerales bacterium]
MWERFSYYGMRALLVLYLVSIPATAINYEAANSRQIHLHTGDVVGVVPNEPGAIMTGTVMGSKDGVLIIKSDDGIADKTFEVAAGAAAWIDVRTPANPGPGWSSSSATLLYGWYTGLVYLLPIIGGFIADRFIGTHKSMIVGGLLIALGHIALAVSGIGDLSQSNLGMSTFIGGLALIIMGTGHFKPCVSVMVGQLYGRDDPRRDGGFTVFYMGINLGAFICAFICGTLGEKVGWHWGFGSAAIGMILGLITYTSFRKIHLQGIGLPPANSPEDTSTLFFMGSVAVAVVAAIFYGLGGFGWLSWALDSLSSMGLGWVLPSLALAGVLLFSGWLVGSQETADKGPVIAILVFILFNTFFWMAFEQAGSTLNLFASDMTDRWIGGWEMPASWFQSVNPLIILLLGPLFAIMWSWLGNRRRDPSQAVKIGLGLLLLGMGYMVIVMGARTAAITGAKVGIWWLVGTYFFHTLGELCLSPTGLSFVTKAAPVKFMSLLMGVWFLSSFAAGVLGGQIGSAVEQIASGEISLPWYSLFRFGGEGDFYFLFVITSVVGGVLMLALAPAMRKLLHGRGD